MEGANGALGPGLDVKADGGYVILPPSTHPSGHLYAWNLEAHPDDLPLADLPDWIEKTVNGTPRETPRTADPLPDQIPDGKRNETLTSLAGSMRRRGATREAITAALLVENSRCSPPLADKEIQRIAESIAKYEPVSNVDANREPDDTKTVNLVEVLPAVDVLTVEESRPEFRVSNLVPMGAVSQTWASRGGFKSWFELALALHLLQDELPAELFGVPDLHVVSGYRRVLWLACEETAGRLHYRARRLLRGCGLKEPEPGSLIHLPARGDSFALTVGPLPGCTYGRKTTSPGCSYRSKTCPRLPLWGV